MKGHNYHHCILRHPVVIMDTENDIKEAYRKLSDKSNYEILQTDPTLQHNKMVNDTLEQFKKENLPQKTAEGLKTRNPKTTKFCITPKICKENHPRRPVTNSINCHTSEILCFVDHHLQPLVKKIKRHK